MHHFNWIYQAFGDILCPQLLRSLLSPGASSGVILSRPEAFRETSLFTPKWCLQQTSQKISDFLKFPPHNLLSTIDHLSLSKIMYESAGRGLGSQMVCWSGVLKVLFFFIKNFNKKGRLCDKEGCAIGCRFLGSQRGRGLEREKSQSELFFEPIAFHKQLNMNQDSPVISLQIKVEVNNANNIYHLATGFRMKVA